MSRMVKCVKFGKELPGLEKAQYHVKVPDRGDFASMLVDLMLVTKPRLAIMDAIVAANDGSALAYGSDEWTARIERRFAELFDTDGS